MVKLVRENNKPEDKKNILRQAIEKLKRAVNKIRMINSLNLGNSEKLNLYVETIFNSIIY